MTDHEFRPLSAAEYNARQAGLMTEARLQAVIVAAAQRAGWLVYHTHDSRRSEPGYPDLHLVHERRHLHMMRELKTEKGRLTDPQKRWLHALVAAGVDADVWRPADWFSGHITEQLTEQLTGPAIDLAALDEAARKLGIELLPWQRAFATRVLRGDRNIFVERGRGAGWTTVHQVIDEARNPKTD